MRNHYAFSGCFKIGWIKKQTLRRTQWDMAIDKLVMDCKLQPLEEDEKGIIAADLRVETKEGVVVLYGVQSEMESISAVLRRISRVRGVVEVINRIRVIRAEDERSTRKNLHSL